MKIGTKNLFELSGLDKPWQSKRQKNLEGKSLLLSFLLMVHLLSESQDDLCWNSRSPDDTHSVTIFASTLCVRPAWCVRRPHTFAGPTHGYQVRPSGHHNQNPGSAWGLKCNLALVWDICPPPPSPPLQCCIDIDPAPIDSRPGAFFETRRHAVCMVSRYDPDNSVLVVCAARRYPVDLQENNSLHWEEQHSRKCFFAGQKVAPWSSRWFEKPPKHSDRNTATKTQ